MKRPPKAYPAPDKTDRTDKTPRRSPGRAEIEAALDAHVPAILAHCRGREALPGWHVAFGLGLHEIRIGQARVPFMAPPLMDELLRLAERNPHAHDAARFIAAMQVAAGMVPSAPLRRFAALALAGEIQRPPRTGRPRAGDVQLRIWQFALCRYTERAGGLHLARNAQPKGAPRFNACQAVADAFTRAGCRTTYGQMVALCQNPEHADIRAAAEALGLLDFADTGWLESEAVDLDGRG